MPQDHGELPYGKIADVAQIGAAIRNKRRAIGMRQSELAALSGVGTRYPGIAARLAMAIGESDDPGHICGRDWRRLAESVGVAPAFVLELVQNLAEAIPERAREIAAELREGRGPSPATELILPVLRKRSRLLLQLLRQ